MTTMTHSPAAEAATEARKAAERAQGARTLTAAVPSDWRTPGGGDAATLARFAAEDAAEAHTSALAAAEAESNGDHYEAEAESRIAYDAGSRVVSYLETLRAAVAFPPGSRVAFPVIKGDHPLSAFGTVVAATSPNWRGVRPDNARNHVAQVQVSNLHTARV